MSGEQWVALVAALMIPVAALLTYLGTKGKTKTDAKTALDERIDARVKLELERVYKRLDDVEKSAVRRASAFARILRSIADQWTGEAHGPNLDPLDIAEVEDTIPPQWLRYPTRKD